LIVVCPSEKTVVGGGARSSNDRLVLSNSYPFSDGSWLVSFRNEGGVVVNYEIDAYAICVHTD
jgi:hypothetical protein